MVPRGKTVTLQRYCSRANCWLPDFYSPLTGIIAVVSRGQQSLENTARIEGRVGTLSLRQTFNDLSTCLVLLRTPSSVKKITGNNITWVEFEPTTCDNLEQRLTNYCKPPSRLRCSWRQFEFYILAASTLTFVKKTKEQYS